MQTRFIVPLCLFIFSTTALAESAAELEEKSDWAAALGVYLTQLTRQPDDPAALSGAWRSAMHLGLYDQADNLHARLTTQQQAALEGDKIATTIRHGRIDARTLTGVERYRTLDSALSATDALDRAFTGSVTPEPEQQRRLIDRMTALVGRQLPAQAIDLYRRLIGQEIPVPDWALGDVASAYLTEKQPVIASQLYQQILSRTPDDFDANIGLFYALVESEQLDAAQTHIDQLSLRLPVRQHLDGGPNGERTSAAILSDQLRVYANQIHEARQRIAQRLAQIPYNPEARHVKYSVDVASGWRYQAEQALRSQIDGDPHNTSLRIEHMELLLALQHWDESRAEWQMANELDPFQPRVLLANEIMALHESPELTMDSGFGHGEKSDPSGSSDWHLDTRLYSSPMNNDWRLFLHNYSSNANYDNANVDWNRTGAGLEWRSGAWNSSAEINTGEFARSGLLSAIQWHPDDFWTFHGNLESLTNDISLQAVNARITANLVNTGIDWQADEDRKLAWSNRFNNFSDGNHRRNMTASWFERWYSGPHWSMDTTLGADVTHNSLGYAAAYFNPPDDHAVWLTGAIDNMTWRAYDWSFHQRLALTAGDYWQSGFGTGSTQAIEYQQRWELGRSVSLHYGWGRSLRPYDGIREARNFGTMTLQWRL